MTLKYNEVKLSEKAGSYTDIYLWKGRERKINQKSISTTVTVTNHDQGTTQDNTICSIRSVKAQRAHLTLVSDHRSLASCCGPPGTAASCSEGSGYLLDFKRELKFLFLRSLISHEDKAFQSRSAFISTLFGGLVCI